VSLITTIAKNGKSLDVKFDPRFRPPPKKVVLHHPPLSGLANIRVNGKTIEMSRKTTVLTRS